MSTRRGDGSNIPSGVDPKSAGTVRAEGGDIPSGFSPIPSGTARGGGSIITSGMHDPSPVSTIISLNPGAPLVLNSITYQIQEVISNDTGEAEIFLLLRDGNKYVFKLYNSNIRPKEVIVEQLKQLKHEDIINLLDYGYYHDHFFEIMDYAEGGALDKYLPIKDVARLKGIIAETVNAFKYFHSNGIVHRDIKPENLYFKHVDGKDILVGDFGISTALDTGKSRRLVSQGQTVGYGAPEMYGIDDKAYIGKEVDYYALGITLIHIWDGKSPFDGLGIHAISNLTICGKIRFPDNMPREVEKLVKGLITVDYTQRWGYDEIQRWLKGEDVPVHHQIKEYNYPPYQFSPTEAATTTEELADILKKNRDKGIKHLYSGKLSAWVNLFKQGLAVELDGIVEDDYPTDQEAGIQKAIYILNPDEPYVHAIGQGHEEYRSDTELADAFEDGFSQYLNQLSNLNHPFYLYLEAHEAKQEADSFRKYYKTFSPKKSLNTIILELRGRESFKLGDELFFTPEDLLKYKDQQYLVNELKDTESRVSLWIAGSQYNEIKERVEKWRKLDWDEFPIKYVLSQKASPSPSNTLKVLSDQYIVALRQWANEAARRPNEVVKGNAAARAHLATIYKEKLLSIAGEILDNPIFAAVEQRWQAALDDYKRLHNLVKGKHNVPTATDDGIRAQLLLASLPDSDNDIAHLRQRAQQAATADARRCLWFRNLGDSATVDPAALILILSLAGDAEAETKKQRIQERTKRLETGRRLVPKLAIVLAISAAVFIFYNGGKETTDIEHFLSLAEQDLISLRLTTPKGNNAYYWYKLVLKKDPKNRRAIQGLEKIVDQYVRLAKIELKRGNHNKAIKYLKRGIKVIPNSTKIQIARQKIMGAKGRLNGGGIHPALQKPEEASRKRHITDEAVKSLVKAYYDVKGMWKGIFIMQSIESIRNKKIDRDKMVVHVYYIYRCVVRKGCGANPNIGRGQVRFWMAFDGDKWRVTKMGRPMSANF